MVGDKVFVTPQVYTSAEAGEIARKLAKVEETREALENGGASSEIIEETEREIRRLRENLRKCPPDNSTEER